MAGEIVTVPAVLFYFRLLCFISGMDRKEDIHEKK